MVTPGCERVNGMISEGVRCKMLTWRRDVNGESDLLACCFPSQQVTDGSM